MPIQLRLLAIILAVLFFVYMVRLVRKDKAEIRHMLKWLVLALIILIEQYFQKWEVELLTSLEFKPNLTRSVHTGRYPTNNFLEIPDVPNICRKAD